MCGAHVGTAALGRPSEPCSPCLTPDWIACAHCWWDFAEPLPVYASRFALIAFAISGSRLNTATQRNQSLLSIAG